VDNRSLLKWTTQNEFNLKQYEVEKSNDGIHFMKVGTVPSVNDINGASYFYNDPDLVSNVVYYRLKLSEQQTSGKYSKVIVLFNKNGSFRISMANPFKNNLKIDIYLPDDGVVEFDLYDMYGKPVAKKNLSLTKGNAQVELERVNVLPAGIYILKAAHNGVILQNKLIKLN
jgi:hypothetical protein